MITQNNYRTTMVRKYTGDISGNFWFAVQGSGDISNLITIKECDMYRWRGCGCSVTEQGLDYLEYCKQCYGSKDACTLDIWKKTGYKTDDLYEETKQIYYNIFADKHLEQLESSLLLLRNKIDKRIIEEVDKVENLKAICHAESGIFDNMMKVYNQLNKTEPLVANPDYVSRYCLGVQIRYRLNLTGSCYVICEL